MFCINCGKELKPKSNFCSSCQTPVRREQRDAKELVIFIISIMSIALVLIAFTELIMIIGVIGGIIGLISGYHLSIPPGGTIVMISIFILLLSMLIKRFNLTFKKREAM